MEIPHDAMVLRIFIGETIAHGGLVTLEKVHAIHYRAAANG